MQLKDEENKQRYEDHNRIGIIEAFFKIKLAE